jgi:hypothetical protein
LISPTNLIDYRARLRGVSHQDEKHWMVINTMKPKRATKTQFDGTLPWHRIDMENMWFFLQRLRIFKEVMGRIRKNKIIFGQFIGHWPGKSLHRKNSFISVLSKNWGFTVCKSIYREQPSTTKWRERTQDWSIHF